MSGLSIVGPGGPAEPVTMSGGDNEPHPEPVTIGQQTVYRVERGADGTDTAAVIYEGPSYEQANKALDETDPGEGWVSLLEDGETVETRRAEPNLSASVTVEPTDEQPAGQTSAFDAKPFTAKRPEVDGVETDTMKVSISGSWDLDPMNADDVAFFNRLQRGQSLDLRVEVEVVDRSAPYKRSAQTDQETITGIAKVKVLHVHRLSPEEL